MAVVGDGLVSGGEQVVEPVAAGSAASGNEMVTVQAQAPRRRGGDRSVLPCPCWLSSGLGWAQLRAAQVRRPLAVDWVQGEVMPSTRSAYAFLGELTE